jgi:CubicO group peptidase (beta-lactamase class C family)
MSCIRLRLVRSQVRSRAQGKVAVLALGCCFLALAALLVWVPEAISKQLPPAGSGGAVAIADSIVQPAMSAKQLPGLVLAVVRDGQPVVVKGYGVKSFASGQVPNANTVFYIGSLSKALTAIGAMLLLEQGKLDLDAPASRYLKRLPRSWYGITVKQFMAHQSGIPQLERKLPTFEQMLRSADRVPLSFPPGTRQEYNNFNFAVAGKVIEAVSGLKYVDFMQQRVFGPLHMDHTGAHVISRNRAISYRPTPDGPIPIQPHFRGGPYGIPSGHLQSTLTDLLKLYNALARGTLLKPASYELMVTRIQPGLSGTPGWFERKAGGDSIVTKNGATQGFQSIMSFVSGKGDGVIMLWTSQKPKGNGLFKVTNQLLGELCNVPTPGHVEPVDHPEGE